MTLYPLPPSPPPKKKSNTQPSQSIGSLSTEVREPQTVTGSQIFLFLARFCSSQWTGKALVGRLWLGVTNMITSKRSKKKKILLLVAIRGSRISELKFPIISCNTYMPTCLPIGPMQSQCISRNNIKLTVGIKHAGY